MNRRVMLVAIAAALFLGLGAATVAWRPWQEKPASRPPVASPVKPPNRTELQLGQNAGEESRTVTFRDDKVRYLEINFKDGARAFVWREGTAADGRSIVSRAEEVLKNRTRLQYEFLIQGDQPVLESITLWRPPTADGQPGAKLLRIEGDRTTFYQENGQAVQATLSVQRDGTKETGYTFTWYEGLVPGKEAKVLEEVYTQAYVSDNDMSDPFNYYGTTRLSYTTKITVAARDNVPSYRQIYMPPADNPYGGGRYYYGGSGGGRFSGRLGAPGRFNPYGQPPQPERPAVLEYTFADS